MNPINLLLNRQSNAVLKVPAPTKECIEQILEAGARVPDHGGLQPWRIKVISGEGLGKLSDLFVLASAKDENANIEKIKKMPFRAPMIMAISTDYKEHKKVPKQEQLITAACCVHAMQMAAFSLGYGSIWRTGTLAYNDIVKDGLEIAKSNELVGFLYIGTACKTQIKKTTKCFEDKVSYWV